MIEIKITEDEFGQRGGKYYFIENNFGKLVRISDIGLMSQQIKTGRGYRKTYKVKCFENDIIYAFDFSSGNNRYFSVVLYKASDFLYKKNPNPIKRYYDENEISKRFEDKFQLSNKIKSAIIEYKNLQPLVKDLINKFPKGLIDAPPATQEAILRPDSYLISVFGMSKHNSVPKSLTNIIKYFKQLYEVKAIIDGLGAKLEKLNLSRKGSFFPCETSKLENLSSDIFMFFQITFKNPNFIIYNKNKDEFYTIWYEFSLARDIRPDFFILKGKHESPFKEEVYDFLSSLDKNFINKIVNQWRSGLIRLFTSNISIDLPSKKEIEKFLIKLAKFLKNGLIIESKESINDFKTKTTQRQLTIYPKIFSNQKLLLISWVSTPKHIHGFDIIDNFNIDVESTKKLINYIGNVLK